MKCPSCGKESSGAFCSSCGAPLQGARCKACNAPFSAGARYCTKCGQAVRGGRAASGSLAWYVAGAAILAVILLLLFMPRAERRSGLPPGAAPLGAPVGGAASGSAAPGPLTGTPREQADRLFNRVMQTRESGDSAGAVFFVPMAIQAYQMAGAEDNDALYHLSLLQNLGGQPDSAQATAERVLAGDPNHLLALAAAAQAARSKADQAAARRYYERFLSGFEAEQKRTLPEYVEHSRILPEYRTEAQQFVGR